MKNVLKVGDIIVIAIILLISVPIIMFSVSNKAEYAVIYVDGGEYGRYHLSEEQEIRVESEYGYNIVKIENKKAYVTETDCKDKLEVIAGSISMTGESLVCLPNRIVITIEGGAAADATTF